MTLGLPNATSSSAGSAAGDVLRRFVAKRPEAARCELCSAVLPDAHEHLVEAATRTLLCACGSCAVLFGYQADQKYRRVPHRVESLQGLRLSEPAWNALGIPINLAFFVYSSAAQRVVAIYPSPAGPTESLLELDAWEQLVDENPELRELEPDVEALLVHRVGDARRYYRVPVDECYKLVGLIRRHWQGFSGGPDVWREIDAFFQSLDERISHSGRSGQNESI